MGCFSWMFADKDNEKNLKINHKGYLLLPNGGELKESCYEGYGEFDGQDAYDLVVDWNRKYLSGHPEFEIPQHNRNNDPSTKSLNRDEVVAKILEDPKAPYGNRLYDYRFIGIDIACYDDQNAALPYPIKVVSKRGINYNEVPASKGDPNQGLF